MKTFSRILVPVFVICWLLTALWGALCHAEPRTNWLTDAYRKNCPSIVFIQGDKIDENARSEKTFNGMGTGIVVDERGYIVTNYHVVKDIRKIQVTTYDQKTYTAVIAAKDADTDLALVKITPRTPLRPIAFGRSNDLMPGESCIAIGNPYGYPFSLTNGHVSAINREVGVNESSLVYRQAIQTNTEINPGNSGGPLINVNGEMIGINVAIRQGATGIAFAIPVDQVVNIAAKMVSEVVEAQLAHGITVAQIDGETNRFVVVAESVESNSPAGAAGIKAGDTIMQIGKYTIRNKLDFYRALIGLKTDEEIAFTVLRQNDSLDIPVAIGSAKKGDQVRSDVSSAPIANRSVTPKTASAAPKTANPASSKKLTAAELDELVWQNLGIRYETLPIEEYKRMFPEYVSEFPYGGVVVKSVRDGSPMARGHVTPGDVIVGIDNWTTTNANDLRYIGNAWSTVQTKGDKIHINVFRDKQHYYAELPLQ